MKKRNENTIGSGGEHTQHEAAAPRRILPYAVFFPASFIFLEIVLRMTYAEEFFTKGLFYTVLFAISSGCLAAAIATLGGARWNRVAGIIIMVLATILFGTQAVYYNIFKEFVTIVSFSKAGMVLGAFWKDALQGIWHTIIPLIFIFTPLVLIITLGKRFSPRRSCGIKGIVLFIAVALACHFTDFVIISRSTTGIMSDKYVYSETFSPVLAMPRFGAITTARLDFQNLFKNEAEEIPVIDDIIEELESPEPSESAEPVEPSVTPVVYGANTLDIDFKTLMKNEDDSAILDMHSYFSSVEPTLENEYTGMFKGKNLIWIVAESFSTLALDETHTPTLCKLSKEGFVFNNFYNPIWGVSTSDGEYVATTGLIPKTGVWSYSRSSDNYMPFGFGNLFSALGYSTRAYHNHTYTYYDRELSYPNMGYDYKGLGSGLDVAETWPESDVEMIEKTVDEYTKDENFLVYYLTVSGHLYYNFFGNEMCMKHESDVADLPYSEEARAYIAGQMEFDQSMELLIKELTERGVLDDTLIVISGDHYPYGLDISSMEELNGGAFSDSFEKFKSTLIIWNPQLETTQVDKYCSSLDIMPTLANLFGLEYDSRLVMGRDILSDSEGLVIFSDRSFITEAGTYDASYDEFTPAPGSTAGDDYARAILEDVNDKFSYSEAILDNDYYAEVFDRDE